MFRKVLFYYCFALALFISISGILSIQNFEGFIYQILFLPVTFYFAYYFFRSLIMKKPIPSFAFVSNFKVLTVASIIFFILLTYALVKTTQNVLEKSITLTTNSMIKIST